MVVDGTGVLVCWCGCGCWGRVVSPCDHQVPAIRGAVTLLVYFITGTSRLELLITAWSA